MASGGRRWVDPDDFLPGRVLLLAPHMDDCVLGCGGTVARLREPESVHVVYATDGSGSPAPLLPWRDRRDTEALVRDRASEARRAMGSLGVPPGQVHFLGLPDGRLAQEARALEEAVRRRIQEIRPDHVLAPFRLDHHLDHLALNRCATALCASSGTALTEYFVYPRSRLLGRGDVREYVHPGLLAEVDIETVGERKAEALRLFRSQTTLYYGWQTRPTLSPELIEATSRAPEVFLRYDPAFPGTAIFTHAGRWIRFANRVEPVMKRRKDQATALLRRTMRGVT
jgi:LmbE family N-acetylglucosaminyl deacetylase